jgi:HK97 family phage major capsid protein
MKIDTTKLLAMRKHAGVVLRRVTDNDPLGFEPNTLEWSDLGKRQKEVLLAARSNLDRISDKTSADEAQSLELAHEGLMEIHDAFEAEKDQRTGLGSRDARPIGGDRRPNQENRSSDDSDWDDLGGDGDGIVYALRPEQRMADRRSSRSGGTAYRGLTDGAYLRAMVLGAKSDTERRALSEGSDSGGGYTVPDILSDRLIDRMRSASVVIRAGAQTVPLLSDTNHIATVATDPVPAWRAEAGAVAESGPTFGRVTFTPRSLAVLVKVSRELLEDSLNLERVLPEILASAMASEVDRVALFGTGVAPQPKGIANIAGVNAIALGAALSSYVPLVRARTAILTANAPDVTAVILHPRDEGALAEMVDGQGQPRQLPRVLEKVPFLCTTAAPIDGGVGTDESTIITGYFPKLLIGVRSALRIEVLKERFADNMQFGFLAHLRVDVAVEHAAAFTKITGIQPTEDEA